MKACINPKKISDIDFGIYLQELTQMLVQTYSNDPGKVVFQIDCPDLKLKIDKANPLGFVLNELISNSNTISLKTEKAPSVFNAIS